MRVLCWLPATEQPNGWMDSWADFWIERRLKHMIRLSERNGGVFQNVDEVVEKVCVFVPEVGPGERGRRICVVCALVEERWSCLLEAVEQCCVHGSNARWPTPTDFVSFRRQAGRGEGAANGTTCRRCVVERVARRHGAGGGLRAS